MKAIPFKNSYFELGSSFYQAIGPVPVRKPELIISNHELNEDLGLAGTPLDTSGAVSVFAGNQIPAGAAPLAMAYSGHQFGHFNPNLGDGRAILLGQITSPDDRLYDIHMKGTGQTAFSRNGDGRAALGPVLREYLVSEAMAKLGAPTTRALAAVSTGEEVIRERKLPGAIITRVASSFVRIGTFQHFHARGEKAGLKRLADYMIETHYQHLEQAENAYLGLLDAVIFGQAELIAKWMHLGFIHGVMNTDNMSVTCETIDYGPCAFMDHFAYDRVFSSIDHHGRYAYNNQPNVGLWNLTRFAECLLHLIDEDTERAVEIAKDRLEGFIRAFQQHWLTGMRAKIGFKTESERDKVLIEDLLTLMANQHVDYTQTFYQLSLLGREATDDDAILALFDHADSFVQWLDQWRERLQQEGSDDQERKTSMRRVNPIYIPRNHLIEAAIRAAEDNGDFSVFHDLHEILRQPYDYQSGRDTYMQPPQPHEIVHQTFCGT